eukprot:740359-Amphidinium_carterae.1
MFQNARAKGVHQSDVNHRAYKLKMCNICYERVSVDKLYKMVVHSGVSMNTMRIAAQINHEIRDPVLNISALCRMSVKSYYTYTSSAKSAPSVQQKYMVQTKRHPLSIRESFPKIQY